MWNPAIGSQMKLFLPACPVGRRRSLSTGQADVYPHRTDYYEKSFTQYETGKFVNEYNGIANVFQSFYAMDSDGQEAKGMASCQLVYFDDCWWISDVLWTTNTNGIPIPQNILKNNVTVGIGQVLRQADFNFEIYPPRRTGLPAGRQVWFLLFAIWFFVFPRISCFTLRAFHSYNLKNIFFLYKK